MSATSAPYGMRPIWHPSGLVRAQVLADGIASGYATGILQGQAVKFVTGGTIEAAAAGDRFVGSFAGVKYVSPTTGRLVVSNQWVASTTYVAGSLEVSFYSDPFILYAMQAAGSLAQTSIGDQADFSNATAGSTTTGLSEATLSTTLAGAGNNAGLRIIDLFSDPQNANAWGDAFTQVIVQIAEHQFLPSQTAI